MAKDKSSSSGAKPETGKTTRPASGADMTLIGYEEDEDGDTFTWTLEWPAK